MSATNIVGNNSPQTITADANDVQLWGEGGADTINGNGLGNLIGGGNDTSGRTKDILNGLGGADILLIQTGDDALNGGSGHDIARFASYQVIDTVVMVGPVPVVTDRNGFEIETVLPVQFPNFFEAVFSLDNANKFRVGTFDILDTSLGFIGTSGSNSKPNTSGAATSTNLGLMTVSSIEEFQLSQFNDVFYGNDGSHIIDGRDGNDFLDGGAGADTLDGGAGNDTASYQRSDVRVSIVLDPTLNSLGLQSFGHAEGDRLISIENLIGSSFNDFFIADSADNELHGQSGDDTMSGLNGNDKLFGGNGRDTLNGNAGFDELHGGSENDTLAGGGGLDIVDGGTGIDTATYAGNTGAITAFLANTGGFQQRVIEHVGSTTATATASVNGVFSIDELTSIENLTGSRFDDRISGSEEKNLLQGGSGADVINGAGNDDTLLGGAQNDELRGDAGNDTLDGGADNDKLFGGIGNDLLRGGLGIDNLDGGADNDTADFSDKTQTVIATLNGNTVSTVLVGVSLEDTLVNIENLLGGTTSDRLTGDGFANNLNGNGGNDLLAGLGGLDTLDGGSGRDTADYSDKSGEVTVQLNGANFVQVGLNGLLEDNIRNIENVVGGSGKDIIFGDSLVNEIFGAGGDDKISGKIGDDLLNGGDNRDSISGDENNDTIHGDNGDDLLSGGADNDHVFGDADNDTVNGGLGLDELDGGTGLDTVTYIEKTTSVRVELFDNLDSTVFVNGVAEDTIRNFENAIGGSAGDNFSGNSLANNFDGRDGDDFFNSDAGADTYIGNIGTDTVSYFFSNTGVSVNLLTSTGLRGDAEGDSYSGVENLLGSLGQRDILVGDNGVNVLSGSGGDDTLSGAGDNDILDGGTGADTMNGGNGFDTATYFTSAAAVNINLLTSSFSGGDATGDQLSFIENIDGSGVNSDTLTGSDIANIIRGFGGDDIIRGEGGIDKLEGGSGADDLFGGAGADEFIYRQSDWGTDEIFDYADGVDHLTFSTLVANDVSDFTIIGNGTSSVTISLVGVPANNITLTGSGFITVDAADFIFTV